MSDPNDYSTECSLIDGHIINTEVNGQVGQLDLNHIVGNVNGALSWGGHDFSNGAQNVQMTDGHTLAADLPDSNGNMVHSELIIGAGLGSNNGQQVISFGVAPPYSEVHADANSNSDADSAAHAKLSAADNQVLLVQTVQGNAADYWPQGNAPAAGHSYSGRMAARIGIFIFRQIGAFA